MSWWFVYSAAATVWIIFNSILLVLQRRVWLTTPYFVPDESLLNSLVTAALRGVDVRVIVPKRSDSRLLDLAARSYFPELLEGRVRVFEYEPRFVHAKTIVCDHDLAIVGTANFDNRSVRLNFEVGVLLFGAQANAQLAAMFERDSKSSRELIASDRGVPRRWQRRSRRYDRARQESLESTGPSRPAGGVRHVAIDAAEAVVAPIQGRPGRA